jgi:hypothetical protein
VSGKAPQTYILHSVGIALVLIALLITFLRHKWGGH